MIALDLEGVAASTGAACAAGGVEPSHVLKAMGFPPERVQSSLRLSLGRTTTEAEVDRAADVIAAVVGRQRQRRPTARGTEPGQTDEQVVATDEAGRPGLSERSRALRTP